MKTKAARKWRLSSVVLALAIWLGIGLSAPVLVHLTSSTLPLSSSLPFRDAVVAAHSNSYSLVRPVEVAGSALVRVDRGTILLTDANGKLVSSSQAAAMLTGGTGTLVLDGATVQLAGPPQAATEETSLPVAPLAEALAKLRTDTVMLRRSTVGVSLPGGHVETMYGVDATMSFKRKGHVLARGKGTLRGQRITFELSSGLQLEQRAGSPDTVPMRAQIKAPHLEFNFDGRMGTEGGITLDGPGDVTLTTVRQVARWLGAYWPQGPGLKTAVIKGHLAWNSRSLTFDRATTRIDGNEAAGALELALTPTRPLLGGTLAFKTLDLSPYLRDTDGPADRSGTTWSSLVATVFSVPLGGLLDADLRLSAERVLLDAANLGSSAASISLKDGKLLADIAELQVGSGRGAMQIRADLTAFRPRLALRGKLDNVDLGRLLHVADRRPLLQAQGSVVLDLTATGTSGADLVRTISGRIGIRPQDAGRIGLDLRRGLATAAENDIEGWGPLTRGTTMFDSAEIKLIAREGVLFTEAAEARNGEGVWAATGLINLAAGRLDLRLTQVPSAHRASVQQPGVLEIRGPWSQPAIRAIADPGSARAPNEPMIEPARKAAAPPGRG